MNNSTTSDFIQVIEQHKGILYKIINSYCNNEEDRKDLFQEIVIHLWKSFEKYDAKFRYSTWIYRIALNVSISFYRKENRRKKISAPMPEHLFVFSEVNLTDEKEQNINLLQQFISNLKELDKGLMLLYLEQKSYKEIAEIIGITETNVATKIARIKTTLKQQFLNLKNQ